LYFITVKNLTSLDDEAQEPIFRQDAKTRSGVKKDCQKNQGVKAVIQFIPKAKCFWAPAVATVCDRR